MPGNLWDNLKVLWVIFKWEWTKLKCYIFIQNCCFVLQGSGVNQVKYLFLFLVFFCTHEQFTVWNILETEHTLVPLRTYTSGVIHTNFILDIFLLMFWKCVKLRDKRQCMSLGSPRWKVVNLLASFSFGWWRRIISFCTSATVFDQQVPIGQSDMTSLEWNVHIVSYCVGLSQLLRNSLGHRTCPATKSRKNSESSDINLGNYFLILDRGLMARVK